MQRLLATCTLLLLAATAAAEVKTTDETWHDDARDRDVPVRIYLDDAATTKPAPVILLSHGLGGSRRAMAFAAAAWAAHGYVCVTLQHAGSDEAIWQGAPAGERLEAAKAGMNVKAYVDRCRDVSFAIDELGRRNKDAGALDGKLDLDRVGLAGHSFGAQTVQAIIGQRTARMPNRPSPLADPRVKAAIAFSPSYERDNAKAAFADVKVPCFHFTGTEDTTKVTDVTLEQRRIPFDSIAAPEQYLVILDGGDHGVFGGGDGRRLAEPKEYAAWHKLIIELSTKFWDAELRGDVDAKKWLANDARRAVGPKDVFEAK